MTSVLSDAILVNQTNLALARSRRLIASWLPRGADAQPTPPQVDDEAKRDEEEEKFFCQEPELLGVGATPPASSSSMPGQDEGLSQELVKLRKNLGLPRKMNNASSQNTLMQRRRDILNARKPSYQARQARVAAQEAHWTDDEDEAEARSKAFGSKKRKDGPNRAADVEAEEEQAHEDTSSPSAKVNMNARPGSYLDELLHDREQKQGKRKRKRKKHKKSK